MKTMKIKHVNGPAQAIISIWSRYTTKIGDIITVNDQEAETLLSKEFNGNPVFEVIKPETQTQKKEVQKIDE